MYDGIINVYKEKGYTSHDVVAKMRGILKQKKIGHTGTLDPDAQGVLPVCLGKGTKLCDMLTDKTKTYQAVLLLGTETDTQDTSGQVLSVGPVLVTQKQVQEAVLSFQGEYYQTPPMYSARKVNGKKLYELAREGKEVEREASLVHIEKIQIESIDLPRVTMTVSCSKGTYIRTLCHDIGRKLNCGGCMEYLLRTRVGQFQVQESLRLSQIEELRDSGKLLSHIIPVDQMFSECNSLNTRPQFDYLAHNGNPLVPEQIQIDRQMEIHPVHKESDDANESRLELEPRVRIYDSQGQFIGIYQYRKEKGRFMPEKVFLPQGQNERK